MSIKYQMLTEEVKEQVLENDDLIYELSIFLGIRFSSVISNINRNNWKLTTMDCQKIIRKHLGIPETEIIITQKLMEAV